MVVLQTLNRRLGAQVRALKLLLESREAPPEFNGFVTYCINWKGKMHWCIRSLITLVLA